MNIHDGIQFEFSNFQPLQSFDIRLSYKNITKIWEEENIGLEKGTP